MAFSGNHLDMLEQAVGTMRDNRISFDIPPFDHEDIANIFIKPEDMPALQRAGELIDSRYLDRLIQASIQTEAFSSPVRISIRLANAKPDGRPMYLVPSYAISGYSTEPIKVDKRMEDYLVECINNSISFNYVKTVLRRLDEMCQSAHQVAFFWPVVRMLADITNDGKLIKSFDKKTRAMLPSLPPHLRAACKDTSEIVTAAHMLGEPPKRNYAFTIHITGNRLHYRDTPIGMVYHV